MFQAQNDSLVRFNLVRRVEHIVLLVSFTLLCLTGLPQKFSAYALSDAIIALFGGIELARVIHRLSALTFGLLGAFHLAYSAYEIITKRSSLGMLPAVKDLTDAWGAFLYYLGRRKTEPRYDRYDFKQKVEYWAVVWGFVIMGITGVMMIFPAQVTRLVPGEIIPAAKAAHGGEAILAALAVLTWHVYNAHLRPGIFPFDTSIFTGKIPKQRMIEEHPLEYARMISQAAADNDGSERG